MRENDHHRAANPKSPRSTDPGIVDPQYMDVRAVARMLSVCINTVWKQVAAGRMPKPIKIGAATRWRRANIERWLDDLESRNP